MRFLLAEDMLTIHYDEDKLCRTIFNFKIIENEFYSIKITLEFCFTIKTSCKGKETWGSYRNSQ